MPDDSSSSGGRDGPGEGKSSLGACLASPPLSTPANNTSQVVRLCGQVSPPPRPFLQLLQVTVKAGGGGGIPSVWDGGRDAGAVESYPSASSFTYR